MGRQVKKLADENPGLLLEWNYEKNSVITDPNTIAAYSTIKVWWVCSKCGFEWISDVKHRFQGHGCPECAKKARSKAAARKKLASSSYNLCITNPELIDEWDSTRNELHPTAVTPGAHKKVWWKCRKCGNEWEAVIASRVNGSGCPYCSGRKIVSGINDFLSCHPELETEWNYKRNQGMDPTQCASNSHVKVWWKCRICGNEWTAAISDRSRGNGCPSCSYARRTSEQEQIIYYYIHCVFKDAINSYRPDWIGGSGEIDIYIPSLRVGVEYDGSRWHQDCEKDLKKDAMVADQGITLYRVRERGCPTIKSSSICLTVNPIDYDKNYLIPIIERLICLIREQYSLSIDLPDIDLRRDRTKILASYEGNKRDHSLAMLSPEIVSDWNYARNSGLRPENMANQSNKKVWWKCRRCGYEWESTINNRIKRGCPACSNKVVRVGQNDISTVYPGMAAMWNYEKNVGVFPEMYTPGAEVNAWWKCTHCGYEWQAMIYHIKRSFDHNINGVFCPACVGKVIWEGHNDLKSLRPDLAEEWNYSKNSGLLPSGITLGSTKSIWWKCGVCGHEWHTSPFNRAKNGSNCSACAKRLVAIKNGRPVRCIETGIIYNSATEAGKAIGRSASAISACLKRPTHGCGGFHWEYYEDENE